jgi:hypothetical protein
VLSNARTQALHLGDQLLVGERLEIFIHLLFSWYAIAAEASAGDARSRLSVRYVTCCNATQLQMPASGAGGGHAFPLPSAAAPASDGAEASAVPASGELSVPDASDPVSEVPSPPLVPVGTEDPKHPSSVSPAPTAATQTRRTLFRNLKSSPLSAPPSEHQRAPWRTSDQSDALIKAYLAAHGA